MEYFDICDAYGFPTGGTVERSVAHRDGIPHRTAHVWVARKKQDGYDILLQKRSMDKDSYPGQYDTSSAGHIPAGEEPLPSALRELEEELGIKAHPEDLDYAGMFHIKYNKIFHGKPFNDDEIARVYVYRKPVDISTLTLQASEVDEVRWFDLEEVRSEVSISRELRFCVPPCSLEVLKNYLSLDFVPIRPEHDTQIAKLVRDTLKAYGLDIPGTAYYDEGLNHLSRVYDVPGSRYDVLLDGTGSAVIGGIGLADFPGIDHCCEMQKLYLAPAFRGRGIGTRMIAHLENLALYMGYRRIYLETHTNLEAAIGLYEKCGYREIARPESVVHSTMNKFYLKELEVI